MKTWVVTIDRDGKDVVFKYVDLSEIVYRYIKYEEAFLTMFGDVLEKNRHYTMGRYIKKVITPQGEDYTDRAIFTILGVPKDGSTSRGVLFGLLHDLPTAIGVFPDPFVKIVMNNPDDLSKFLTDIIDKPDFWKYVTLLTTP